MPIRINFLAEEQAAEELRRRDPVKRAVLGGIGAVALVLVWVIVQIGMGLASKRVQASKEAEWEAMKAEVEAVEKNMKQTGEVEKRLMALSQLATNRFLWGSVLNAVQQCMVENVQVVRITGEQSFAYTPAVKPREGTDEKPKPATATERVSLRIRAKDMGKQSDRNSVVFMKTILEHPYFAGRLVNPNGVRFSQTPAPVPDPSDMSRTVYMFELQCVYPEAVRR
jgi:hypothetical protein